MTDAVIPHPPGLSNFDEEPKPAPGCDVCDALTRQRRQALDRTSPAYDPSHATDLAVEIRRHPHPKPPAALRARRAG
jgi:hypothetical protein